MDQNIAISVEHISKSFSIPHENRNTLRERLMHFRKKMTYETFHALDDISFEIRKGEFFSIIGRNGSGKSTLLKILAGIYTPDKGSIRVNGEISPFLELGVGFNPELSGKDNIYLNSTILGLSKKDIDKKFKSIVDFSELDQFIDLKLKNYSSGMQVRLAFATAIQSNRDILLMDEVLAVGDVRFQVKCYQVFEKLIKSGKTIVFVSHDPDSVQKYSDRVLYLEQARMAVLGSPNEALSKYMYSNAIKASETTALEDQNLFSSDGLKDEEELLPSITSAKIDFFDNEPIEKMIEVSEVRFFNKDDVEEKILTHGETMRIDVVYTVNSTVHDLVFKMLIRDQLHQDLFLSSTLAENVTTGEMMPGKVIISYKIPNYFSRGKYSVSPSVCERTQKIYYERCDDFASFQVHQANPIKPSMGFNFPHSINLLKSL